MSKVRVDGYSSNTVEQIGTDSDCQSGVPTYYAWYEFFPHFSFLIDLGAAVGAGDRRLHGSPDGSEHHRPTVQHDREDEQRETVVGGMDRGAPWSGGVLPLANFGIADFGVNYTGVGDTSTATIGPKTGPIGSFGSPTAPNSPVQEITMVTGSGEVKARPLGLSKDGSSFQVQWVSSGP